MRRFQLGDSLETSNAALSSVRFGSLEGRQKRRGDGPIAAVLVLLAGSLAACGGDGGNGNLTPTASATSRATATRTLTRTATQMPSRTATPTATSTPESAATATPTVNVADPFAQGVRFNLSRNPTGSGDLLRLRMSTVLEFPSLGLPIIATVGITGSVLRVDLLDVGPCEGVCLPALGPATFDQSFDVPAGSYSLEFKSPSLTDRYDLEVGADHLVLQAVDASFTQPFD
jgi:hypothetical protein